MRRLRSVPNIGPVTAGAFVAALDDAQRFGRAHEVEAYVGLVSREWSSGETQRRGQITKAESGRVSRNVPKLSAGVEIHACRGARAQLGARTAGGGGPPERATTPTRMALWSFRELQTLRRTLLRRAGRLTPPQGELTLTLSANADVKEEFLHYLNAPTAA